MNLALIVCVHSSGLLGEPIVLDARFDDWNSVAASIVDPADAPDAFVDLGEVRIAADESFVHLLVDFGRTVNVQGLDGTLDIVLNVDGDEATGREVAEVKGADLIVRCSPPDDRWPDRPGRGMGIVSTTYVPNPLDVSRPPLNPYDIGLAFAPTHSGRRIEFRLNRGRAESLVPVDALPPLFAGANFTGRLVFTSLEGTVADQTDVFSSELPPIGSVAASQPHDEFQETDPLAKPSQPEAFRIVSWNAELGAFVSRPEPFVRTLNALKPDVILLQELTDKITVEQIAQVMQHLAQDDQAWSVTVGKGGGDLRCAVFSRLPVEHIASLEVLTYPERPDRSLRATSVAITHAGKKFIASSVHLKCCGRDGSAEDVTRMTEVAIIESALAAELGDGIDGLVIAGDLNLVGSRSIVEELMSGLDIDRSNLETVEAYQIDRRSNATWSDRRQPFVPGRLDWVLYSDSSLQLINSFIYDSADLSARWHQVHGTQPDDTAQASDHLPIVFDLVWR